MLSLVLVFSCTPKKTEKTFIYCSEGSPSSFNPQFITDIPSQVVGNTMFNRLVELEPVTLKIVPRLADSWEISKDGLQYTFKLRKGVKFHKTSYFTPSREMNADDVLFSFNRQRLHDHPFHAVGGGRYEIFSALGMERIVKDIVKVDDHTVKFLLSVQDATFLTNLTMEPFAVLSAEYGDQLVQAQKIDQIDVQPVGTGPFVFQNYEKDSMIRFVTNPDYFLGASPLTKLVFVITPDTNVRTQKMKKGECDLITEPAPMEYDQFSKDPNVNVLTAVGMNIGYLSMNTTKKPFDNILVRKAIAHALNKQSYIDAIFLGLGQIADSPLPPTLWGFTDQFEKFEYSPEKSRELLKQAGLPNGFETELWSLPVSRPYNPDGKKMAEMMQSDLAAVGIKVKITTFDWPTYLTKTKNGEHTMGQFGWTPNSADPDSFLYMLLSCDAVKMGANRSRWCDQEFDRDVTLAKQVSDIGQRTELYQKAQKRFAQELPWVMLANSKIFKVVSKKVTGYVIDPVVSDRFYGVDLKD